MVSAARLFAAPLRSLLSSVIAACLVVGAGAPTPSFGKDKPSKAEKKRAKAEAQQAALAALQRGEILPLDHILDVAQRRVPGDVCLLSPSPSPRDQGGSRMPSSTSKK